MRNLICAICFLTTASLSGQYWCEGAWVGQLEVQGTAIEMVFDFKQPEGDEFGCFLSIAQQNVREFPGDRIVTTDSSFTVFFSKFGAEYTAKRMDEDHVEGEWRQAGGMYKLNLTRTAEAPTINRPQEPSPPFNYEIQGISIANEKATGVTLGATLTIPKGEGPFPAVILVSGSGPQDRNSELMAHKPFWVLSDYLTNHGIIVLRYDDRGVGASTGNFQAATSMDFASDAEAAIDYLKKSDLPISNVGIIGHSEGGIIAPMVGARRPDVDFLVLLAGPTVSGSEILLRQARLMQETEGVDDAEVDRSLQFSKKVYDLIARTLPAEPMNYDTLQAYVKEYYDGSTEEQKKALGTYERFYFSQSSSISSPWFRYFVTHDPAVDLSSLTQSVLAFFGSKDLQVAAEQNEPILQSSLESAPTDMYHIEIKEGLNHLFQHATTGAVSEYGQIEETFDENTMNQMAEWIMAVSAER